MNDEVKTLNENVDNVDFSFLDSSFSRKNKSLLSSSDVTDIDEKTVSDMYLNSNCNVKTFSESFGSIVFKHK